MPRIQPHLGNPDEDPWGRLGFDIVAVHAQRKQLDQPPWHAEGGDWTFLDCRISGPRLVDFLVGVRTRRGKGENASFGWGEATLLTAERAAGEQFLEVFGKAFHQRRPKPRTPRPLQSWKFGAAILGENLERAPEGGFQAKGGSWVATKWFPEIDGFSAEVFFNYNLQLRKGEFSEKDPDYREDLVAAFATALRDGPRPERTPETDPNLTDRGPKIQEVGRLCAKVSRAVFSPESKWIVYVLEKKGQPFRILKVDPKNSGERVELGRLENRIDGLKCVDARANQLLVLEVIAQQPDGYSSDDPQRLWWIDRSKNERAQLVGPWGDKHWGLGDNPVSPDGRFVVVHSWKPRSGGTGNYLVLYIHDRREGKTRLVDLPEKGLEEVGWVKTGAGLRLVFAEGRRWEKGAKLHYYVADPVTGKHEPADPTPLSFPDPGKRTSPDGRRVAELRDKDEVVIVDEQVGQQRVFTLHEDDVRSADEDSFGWVSPRYLKFTAPRLAFLDVESMKMNYPIAKSNEHTEYTFSPDFRWVLWQRAEEGLFLGKIVGAENGR